MKNNHYIALVAVTAFTISSASAVQYIVENSGPGSAANGVTSNAGDLLSATQGSVAFGFFKGFCNTFRIQSQLFS